MRTVTLADAQAALETGAWQAALDALDGLEPLPPEALEMRAMALYALGDLAGSIASWERLHARRSASGDRSEAARAAVMVAMFLLIDSALMAPIRGWLGRSRQLLEGLDKGPVHALVAAVNGYERFFCGDVEAARRFAPSAVELGTKHGVVPAIAIGRTLSARLLLVDGCVDEGIQALDEVGAYLMSGEVDPLTVGMMLCEIICAAQSLAMPDVAREWTEVMERWRHQSAIGGINGRCRVHRAELLRLSGPGDEAEAEALAACEALRPWLQREYGWPLVELGNIRLRRGDLNGSEDAYLAADALSWSPQPGLALLRLAQGDLPSALQLIADAIAHPPDLPWKERPPVGDLQLVTFLDAQSEIAHAAGDADLCASVAERLTSIAQRYRSRGLEATALFARARAKALGGEPATARKLAGAAAAIWVDLRAPYEAAVARAFAADAAETEGNDATAQLERSAARKAFEVFGAHGRLAAMGAASSMRADAPHSSSRTGVFSLEGGMRRVSFDGGTVTTADLVGFRHLARLLAKPGEEITALDLALAERGSTSDEPAPQLGLPALDEQARDAYRRRLVDVEEDIAEAEANNDDARAHLARRDREFLLAELGRAVGLSGRIRQVSDDAERARTAVFRSIRYAIERLGEHSPRLAEHLRRSVSTGTWCRYLPDPLAPVEWDVR
jgi:hypothetical protein